MKTWKTALSMVIIILCVILSTTLLLAKGGGGGGGGGNGGSDGRDGYSGDRGGRDAQSKNLQKNQEQNRFTVQQRTRIRDCRNTAERMQVRIREMTNLASGQTLQAPKLERTRLTLHNEFQQLEKNQSQFSAGLNSQDRDRLRNQLQDMDRSRDRMRTCIQNMESELAQPNPDLPQLRRNIREMEQTMKRWQEQYTQLK